MEIKDLRQQAPSTGAIPALPDFSDVAKDPNDQLVELSVALLYLYCMPESGGAESINTT